jgi:hypothetical protein
LPPWPLWFLLGRLFGQLFRGLHAQAVSMWIPNVKPGAFFTSWNNGYGKQTSQPVMTSRNHP